MRGEVPKMMTKLHTTELPDWLTQRLALFGSDGEGDQTGDTSVEGENGEEGEGEETPAGMTQEDFDKLPADHPLKKALREERKLHRAADRENKRLQREAAARVQADAEAELAKKDELTQEKTKRETAEAKSTKLTQGYLKLRLDSAIEKAARDAKFIDADDALQGVDRSKIEFDQNADDPSIVTIDAASIKKAVADLARRKPHLTQSGTGDGEPSGSPFGGGNRTSKQADRDKMREIYPAL